MDYESLDTPLDLLFSALLLDMNKTCFISVSIKCSVNYVSGTMVSFGCSCSYRFLLENMPYWHLLLDYILLIFWDRWIEIEGIDGDLWVSHSSKSEVYQ